MTIWPKNLFKAKILTQKFIFQPKKYPQKMAHPVSQFMGVTPPSFSSVTDFSSEKYQELQLLSAGTCSTYAQ